MTIYTPSYANRSDVKRATDTKATAYNNSQVDRALQAASRDAEKLLKRKRFYPEDKTLYFDYPPQGGTGGGIITYPWKLYFDANDLYSISAVQSPPGTSLNIAYFNLEPADYGPPYTYLEVQRDKPIAFSSGSTPQRAIQITGTWTYSNESDNVATLSTTVNASTTTVIVSNSANLDAGDLITIDSERMLVQETATATTSDSQQNSGCSTANASDVTLTLANGANVNVGEVLLLDSERMLALDVTGNNVTVKRAYDGSILATHTSATVYAYRSLTVLRGQLGTTAASHTSTTAILKQRYPSLLRSLVIAEAVNIVMQETGGYSRTLQVGQQQASAPGGGLPDIRARARQALGRKSRIRTI